MAARPGMGNGAFKSTIPSRLATDARLKTLAATMKRHQYQPDALIEVLHIAQELFGYLDPDLLLHIANSLKLPPIRVYGVATLRPLAPGAPHGGPSPLGHAVTPDELLALTRALYDRTPEAWHFLVPAEGFGEPLSPCTRRGVRHSVRTVRRLLAGEAAAWLRAEPPGPAGGACIQAGRDRIAVTPARRGSLCPTR